MPRAVHFNGAAGLNNTTLGQLSSLTFSNLSCGIFSYWYRSAVPVISTIASAYATTLFNAVSKSSKSALKL